MERRFPGGREDAGLGFISSAFDDQKVMKGSLEEEGREKKETGRRSQDRRRSASTPALNHGDRTEKEDVFEISNAALSGLPREKTREVIPCEHFDGVKGGYEYTVPPFGLGVPGYYPISTTVHRGQGLKTKARMNAEALSREYAGAPTMDLQDSQFMRIYGHGEVAARGDASRGIYDSHVYGAGVFVRDRLLEHQKQRRSSEKWARAYAARTWSSPESSMRRRKGPTRAGAGPGIAGTSMAASSKRRINWSRGQIRNRSDGIGIGRREITTEASSRAEALGFQQRSGISRLRIPPRAGWGAKRFGVSADDPHVNQALSAREQEVAPSCATKHVRARARTGPLRRRLGGA